MRLPPGTPESVDSRGYDGEDPNSLWCLRGARELTRVAAAAAAYAPQTRVAEHPGQI